MQSACFCLLTEDAVINKIADTFARGLVNGRMAEKSNSVKGVRFSPRNSNDNELFVYNIFDEFSNEDNVKFYEKIGEIRAGKKGAFQKSSNGEFILEINNKLVYTNGNYNNPKIS